MLLAHVSAQALPAAELPTCASPDFQIAHVSNISEPSSVDPVLVDRVSGRPVEVASTDVRVVNGELVERQTGQVVRTAPAMHTHEVPGGSLGLLNMSSVGLDGIKLVQQQRVPLVSGAVFARLPARAPAMPEPPRLRVLGVC